MHLLVKYIIPDKIIHMLYKSLMYIRVYYIYIYIYIYICTQKKLIKPNCFGFRCLQQGPGDRQQPRQIRHLQHQLRPQHGGLLRRHVARPHRRGGGLV